MRVTVALGGNALLKRGEKQTPAAMEANVAQAAAALAGLVMAGHSLLITHGNGPQVGLLALQAEAGPAGAAQPLDSLNAESEGWIGYLLEQELANALPGREIATLLTRIAVQADDPAFAAPSKPIGPVYDEATAHSLAETRGWNIAPDGRFWRRVVPSPAPAAVLNAASISRLAAAGTVVICAGGGGIPVTRDTAGKWRGVQGVIDKDATGALLAAEFGAEVFLLLTDVDAVYEAYGTPAQQPLRRAEAAELEARSFAAGSMGPKVQAACRFVRRTGRPAAIGSLQDTAAVMAGKKGTWIF